ncbi:MAG: hypothetical protein K0R08_2247 [Solimicrobium sp.]|jgi:hypothetical protein|nr:hypothetical protein [Solimicrobium sp.]
MTQNTTTSNKHNSGKISAKAKFCKTFFLSISVLTLCSAPIHAEVCPPNRGHVLKKVELRGDNENGDSVTCTYTDVNEKEIIFNKGNKSGAGNLHANPLVVTPANAADWRDAQDGLVCKPMTNNRCEFINKNMETIHFPDQCGNYSLMEAWERYYKLADALEFTVDEFLSTKFGEAGRCFEMLQEMCKGNTSAYCKVED